MNGPALSIALLVKTQDLVTACRSWLPSNRYTTVDLGFTADVKDFQAALEQKREAVDAVVIEQSLLEPELRQSLLDASLLFPAVVVGEVMGRVDYHPEEVHLPVDQIEQLGYNVDAAISRFLRQGQKEERQAEGQALNVQGESRSRAVLGVSPAGFRNVLVTSASSTSAIHRVRSAIFLLMSRKSC